MPIYPCKCDQCGHYEEPFRHVSEYDQMPQHCGSPMTRVLTAPMVQGDLEPYKSPLDGTWVTSRSEHRNHMRKHDVIEVGNEKLKRPMQKEHKAEGLKQDIAKAIDQVNRPA